MVLQKKCNQFALPLPLPPTHIHTLEETPFCVDGENQKELAKTTNHYKGLKMQTAERDEVKKQYNAGIYPA